jgi:nitrile hydratase alpha subunit
MSGDHDHHHDHHHDHGHSHAGVKPDDTSPPGRYELMTYALQELLVEKGVLKPEQIRRGLETIDSWQPSRGAEVVARAWVDPAFKALLLADGNAAVAPFGVDMGDAKLTVVESTDNVHNVIVCTLCSCYPRALLGLPPDWYRSKRYRARIVREPRAVLAEFGTIVPDDVAVRVHDSLADLRYLVLPRRPAGTDGWSEAKLAAIVTRDSMVGVDVPKA